MSDDESNHSIEKETETISDSSEDKSHYQQMNDEVELELEAIVLSRTQSRNYTSREEEEAFSKRLRNDRRINF
jgi:hypothetical protein